MKTVREYKERWEEANWLRLLYITNELSERVYDLFKKVIVAINVLLYITYQVIRGLFLIIKLLLLTEPSLNKIERDETWIFRQIK